jgi:hypothetical protein
VTDNDRVGGGDVRIDLEMVGMLTQLDPSPQDKVVKHGDEITTVD